MTAVWCQAKGEERGREEGEGLGEVGRGGADMIAIRG